MAEKIDQDVVVLSTSAFPWNDAIQNFQDLSCLDRETSFFQCFAFGGIAQCLTQFDNPTR